MNRPCTARDIMVTDLVLLSPDLHVFDGIAHLLRSDITGAPVVDDNQQFLGVFSEKCCMSVLTVTAELAAQDNGTAPVSVKARDFMANALLTFAPDVNVFDAIGSLLKKRVSGAPVVNANNEFLGVLSERYSMRAVVDAAYDQLPAGQISAFMNRDAGRLVSEEASVLDIAEMFLSMHYRRVVVTRNGQVVGQISRRDVLRAEHHLAKSVRNCERKLLDRSKRIARSDINDERPTSRLPSPEIRAFMDTRARTITEDTDLLGMAHLFLTTNYRRFPVLRDGRLVGQVSRRDLLQTIHDSLDVSPERGAAGLLYLSTLHQPEEVGSRFA